MKTTRLLLLFGLGLVFAYAGALKVADPAAFAEAIARYRILSWPGSVAVALYLPWLELAAVIALCCPGWRRAGQWLLLGRSLGFSAVIASALVRGLDIECGCFGSGPGTSLWFSLTRALALSLCSAALLWLELRAGQMRVTSTATARS